MLPYRVTRGAIDVAEGVAGLVVLRLRQRGDHSDRPSRPSPEPTAWRPPAPNTVAETPDAPPAPPGEQRTRRRPSTNGANGAGSPATARPAPRPRAPRPAPAPRTEPEAAPSRPTPVAPAPEPAEAQVMPTEIVDAEVVSEPPAAPAGPAEAAPAHVSEEATFVESFADAGAEEGAGAQIRIEEPWEGYRQMKAPDIIDRLNSASREELAAVELFETVNRKRKSVLSAAERALRRQSPPRPQ